MSQEYDEQVAISQQNELYNIQLLSVLKNRTEQNNEL